MQFKFIVTMDSDCNVIVEADTDKLTVDIRGNKLSDASYPDLTEFYCDSCKTKKAQGEEVGSCRAANNIFELCTYFMKTKAIDLIDMTVVHSGKSISHSSKKAEDALVEMLIVIIAASGCRRHLQRPGGDLDHRRHLQDQDGLHARTTERADRIHATRGRLTACEFQAVFLRDSPSARAGLAALQPKPSMPYAGGGSFGSAAPKEPKVPLCCDSPASRSQAKSLIKTGRLHFNEKYRPCRSEYNESKKFRADCRTKVALPVLSRSKPRARRASRRSSDGFWDERQVRKRSACLLLIKPSRFGPKEAAVNVWRSRTGFHPLPLAQTVNRHGSGDRFGRRCMARIFELCPREAAMGFLRPSALKPRWQAPPEAFFATPGQPRR